MGQKTPNRDDEGTYTHPDPVLNEALDWYARLQEPADDAVRAQFDAWLAEDPLHAREYARLVAALQAPELDRATSRLADEYGAPPLPAPAVEHRWPVRIAMAACLLLALAGASLVPELLRLWRSDYLTSTGERAEISLPDGSRMILNTASAVAVDFENGRRDVRLLDGEAFFDVVHDTERPFRVVGTFSAVEVKGTAFAVRAADGEDVVALERGRVDVNRLDDRRARIGMTPGQIATATSTGLSAEPGDIGEKLAWREGRFVFSGQPLGEVLEDLRRYFRGSIFVLDSRLDDVLVGGNYRLDDPAGVVRSLAEAVGARMTTLPGGIIILR